MSQDSIRVMAWKLVLKVGIPLLSILFIVYSVYLYATFYFNTDEVSSLAVSEQGKVQGESPLLFQHYVTLKLMSESSIFYMPFYKHFKEKMLQEGQRLERLSSAEDYNKAVIKIYTTYPEDGDSPENLLSTADAGMYGVKHSRDL